MLNLKRWISLTMAIAILLGMLPPVNAYAEASEDIVLATTPTISTAPTTSVEETILDEEEPEESSDATTVPTEAETGSTESTTAPTEVFIPVTEDVIPAETTVELVAYADALGSSEIIVSGTCGPDLTWTQYIDGTLIVSGTGSFQYYAQAEDVPWYYRRTTIKQVIIESGVTDIGPYSFYECSSLLSVSLPDTVTIINDYAFYGCKKLTDCNLPQKVKSIGSYAFYNCNSLKEVKLPQSVEWISSHAFQNCSSIKEINFPENAQMSSYVFSGCNQLSNVILPDWFAVISEGMFENCTNLQYVFIPDSVVRIDGSAFSNCSSLKSIELPPNLVSLSDGAFYGCDALTCVRIPDRIKEVAFLLFADCDNLSQIILPSSITTIQGSAFARCTSLKNIVFPINVKRIGGYAFENCINLKSITLTGNLPTIDRTAFPNLTFDVFYDPNNSTYTPDKLYSHSGNMTWRPMCQEHTEAIDPAVAPTCTKEGISEGVHCSVCNLILKSQVIVPPAGHKEVIDAAVAPTCIETGLTQGKHCSTCGETLIAQSIVNALGHTEVIDQPVASTCTETGLTEGKHCTICREVLIAQYVVDALGHTELPIDGYDATCTEPGLSDGTYCSVCNEIVVEQIEIPALGHTLDEESICVICNTISMIDSGSCGTDVTWQLRTNGTLYISGTGPMPDYGGGETTVPWYIHRAKIKSAVVSEGITTIGHFAFSKCSKLDRVTMPNGVTAIGVCAFADCVSLTSVNIPQSVTSIEVDAFSGCTSLTSIEIPHGVTHLDETFFNCINLETVILPDSIEVINDTFHGCTNLINITLPDGLTTIGHYAFKDCKKLSNLEIPDSVVKIDMGAFWGCQSLTSVRIPDGITDIPNWLFCGCKNLLTVELPETITTIGIHAFDGCERLTSVKLPDGLINIDESAFSDCAQLVEVVIPDSVISVGDFAFAGCSSLANISIGSGIARIERYAFSWCDSLKNMTLPESLTEIEDNAFSYCTNLEWILFTGHAPNIEDTAFYGTNTIAYYPCNDPSWTAEVISSYPQKVTWIADYATSVIILHENGDDITGKTIWYNLNSNTNAITFTAFTLPIVADDSISWQLLENVEDWAEYTVNEDGSLTLHPTGKTGTITIAAATEDGSGKSSEVSVKFCTLEINGEEISGEDPADMILFSGKNKTIKVYDTDTGKALTNKQIVWSMDGVYAPYATLDTKSGKVTAKKVMEKVRIEVIGTIIGSECTTVPILVDIYPTSTQVELYQISDDSENVQLVNNKNIPVEGSTRCIRLNVGIFPLDAQQKVTWTISDKKNAYATYDQTETSLTLSGITEKTGTVTIKATAADGSKKSATVKLVFGTLADTVTIGYESGKQTIEAEECDLVGGKSVQLTASVTCTDESKTPSNKKVTWSITEGSEYASISSSGKVTAKSIYEPQNVVVKAEAADGSGKRDTFTVRIKPAKTGMLLLKILTQKDAGTQILNNVTGTTIVTDTTAKIELSAWNQDGSEPVETVTWKSSSKNAVVADGIVTFTKAGTITITATAGKRTAKVTFKVSNLADDVIINSKNLKVASGKSLTLSASATGGSNKKVIWSIVDGSTYAKITTSGKLTAVKDLTSQHEIKVKAAAADGSGKYAEAVVTVYPLAQGVQVYSEQGGRTLFSLRSDANWWVRSNTTLQWDLSTQSERISLTAHVFPYHGEEDTKTAIQEVTWKSSSTKIADFEKNVDGSVKVDENGNVQLNCKKAGTVTITATSTDGSKQKVSFKLTIVKTVTELSLADQIVISNKSLNLAKLVTINPSDATNKKLTWKIASGNAYATISSSGSFKAKKVTVPQIVVVTVTAQDGSNTTTTCAITIHP